MLIHCLTSYAVVWGKPRMFWAPTNVECTRVGMRLWRTEIGHHGTDWHKENWQAIHIVETAKVSTALFCRLLNGEQWKNGFKLLRVWNRPAIWDAMLEEKLTALLVTKAVYTGDNRRPKHNSARVIRANRMFEGSPLDDDE